MLTFKLTSGAVLKVAVQVLAADIVTEVLGDVPVQVAAPAGKHRGPRSASPVSVTTVPVGSLCVQLAVAICSRRSDCHRAAAGARDVDF